MYVASLNLDLFFKKVFSSKRIAKSFLEDILDVQISEIKILSTDYKISDDAVIVKFDFRCKIQGRYVVIEMQQRYKVDVIKRFYLYHAVSTALQLETLKPVIVTKLNGETYTEKNYSGLKPVITLIWMVDDTLGFEEDFSKFKEDNDMAEVINRLRKDKLSTDEFKYVSDLMSYEILLKRLDLDHKAEMKRQKKAALQEHLQEKQKAEQEKQKAELLQNRLLKSIKMLLQQGGTVEAISEALEISLEETTELVQLIQNNN